MDKEKYKQKIHHFVERLRAESPEMYAYLVEEVNRITNHTEISKIEHYLGLDYGLDNVPLANLNNGEIDYSFIEVKSVRKGLESDYREMMRYRYGCRSHKADFYEYCKYAHFQLEALTNYFMEIWSTPDDSDLANFELAKSNIHKNWPFDSEPNYGYDNTKKIESIPYNTKIIAILTFFNISKDFISHPDYIYYNLWDVLDNIRNVRNDCSHRGESQSLNMQNAIDDFENSKKLKTTSTGKSQVYDFSGRTKVKYYLWLRSTPWDDVIKALTIYVSALKKSLD